MYWPFFVWPYQRSPARWNTFVSVLTQTMPGWAGAGAGAVASGGGFVAVGRGGAAAGGVARGGRIAGGLVGGASGAAEGGVAGAEVTGGLERLWRPTVTIGWSCAIT